MKYTLKVFFGNEHLESYEHRTKQKLKSILSHTKYDRAGDTGPFGEEERNPDKFEIIDSVREKMHTGNIKETLIFVKTLK